mmetsp:Transcript_34834/g.106985  ORF Transcript_34834/g.106985 Transcript_34834/m.106985 type:complete len:275 (+) Transcript_34834:65-889(+)
MMMSTSSTIQTQSNDTKAWKAPMFFSPMPVPVQGHTWSKPVTINPKSSSYAAPGGRYVRAWSFQRQRACGFSGWRLNTPGSRHATHESATNNAATAETHTTHVTTAWSGRKDTATAPDTNKINGYVTQSVNGQKGPTTQSRLVSARAPPAAVSDDAASVVWRSTAMFPSLFAPSAAQQWFETRRAAPPHGHPSQSSVSGSSSSQPCGTPVPTAYSVARRFVSAGFARGSVAGASSSPSPASGAISSIGWVSSSGIRPRAPGRSMLLWLCVSLGL